MNGRFGRRLLGALALLAMVAGLSARADYIIIQVNLNGEYRPLTSAAGAAAGMGGGSGTDGILGGSAAGAPAGPGGPPGGGGPGGPGGKPGPMAGGPGFPPGAGGGTGLPGAFAQLPPEYVFVVVEITKNDLMADVTNAVRAPIRRLATSSGSGIAFNFDTGNPVHVALLKDEGGTVMPSVDKRLGRFITNLGTKGRTKQEESLEISMWALQHGLLKRFEEGMTSLQRDSKTAKVPGVAAWTQASKSLEGSIPPNPMADVLRRRFTESRQQVDGKYCSIITDKPAQAIEEVQKVANQVDEEIRSIYGWFAWHGIAMKPLRQKVLVVMGEKVVPRAGEARFHDVEGGTNLRGIPYSLQQVVVNDPHLRNIQQRLKQFSLKGWNLAKLLKLEPRSYPDVVSTAGLELPKLCDVAYVSMLNIASEALRAETERAERQVDVVDGRVQVGEREDVLDERREAHPVVLDDLEHAVLIRVALDAVVAQRELHVGVVARDVDVDVVRAMPHRVVQQVDEHDAQERGVDPCKLVRVEIPREMFISGTIQQVREYVALYMEAHDRKTGMA